MTTDTVTSHVAKRAFRHGYNITHALPDGYKDGFLATPPEGTVDVQAWAEAEVVRRRGDHGWTVTLTKLRG